MKQTPVLDDVGGQPTPLEVGLAVLDRSGKGASRKDAAKNLVTQALRKVHTDRLPVRCILLLSTADWCKEDPTLPKEVRSSLKEILGYKVPLIGGCMARLFCSTGPKRLIKHGIVLVAFASHDFWLTVTSLEEPHRSTEAERKRRVEQMADTLKLQAGTRLGASAGRHLLGIFPGMTKNREGKLAYYDHELHEEILQAFDHRLRLIGGAAADDLDPAVGYQFANDECLKSGLALAMVETDLAWGSMMGHGFTSDRKVCLAVDRFEDGGECGYIVSKLDGKRAAERFAEIRASLPGESEKLFLGLPSGKDYCVVRPFNEKGDANGAVRLTRKVRRGDRLYVLKPTGEGMKEAAETVFRGALAGAEAHPRAVQVIWGLSDVGRFNLLKKLSVSFPENVEKLSKQLPGVPIFGGLCVGEFGIDQERQSQPNTFSFWIHCLASAHAHRAQARVLQNRLLAAAASVSQCRTPKEVMETALNEAIQGGAEGGQICIVDYGIQRIVGKHLGHAATRPESRQDWSRAAALTDRPTPRTLGGDFPRNLLNYSVHVGDEGRLRIVDRIAPEEDILTLITRTLRAVFVVDARKKGLFHCNLKTAQAGSTRRFLAIPLVGCEGKAIATLQVGFVDDAFIDRETFCHWVSYAQKVAAALERAQEAEERAILEKISALANLITQSPLKETDQLYSWCEDYLRQVMDIFGADSAHIRLLKKGLADDEYLLIAAVGYLAEARFATRKVTREGDGSCTKKLLEGGGRVRNTRAEMQNLNRAVKALSNGVQFGSQLQRGLGELCSTAMLPLCHEGRSLGAFVVDSKQPYFFTERRERMVRAAADSAGAVLNAKTSAYDHLTLEVETKWMMSSLAEAREEAATVGLKGLLARLCRAVQADVGSLYVWHEDPQRLILHTAHNWFEPMEGVASYEPNEGWAGTLAFGDREVSIVGLNGSEPSAFGTKKYYSKAVPPEHRVPDAEPEPRIGARLKAGKYLVGVVTFSYYTERQIILHDEQSRERIMGFLNSIAHLVALMVVTARQEVTRKERERLLRTKDVVVQKLMGGTDQTNKWQPALDVLRIGFEVERVVVYRLREDRIQLALQSCAAEALTAIQPTEPQELTNTLRSLLSSMSPLQVRHSCDPLLREWPNRDGVRSLFAVPIVSASGSVLGLLELANRAVTSDHPYEFLGDSERMAALDVSRSLAAAIESEKAATEINSQLAIANKIGATSLASAIVMHRLMSPLARLRGGLDWIELHPAHAKDDFERILSQMRADCADAIASIHDAASTATGQQRREDLRNIVAQTVQATISQAGAARVDICVSNELRLSVFVNVFALVGAFVNLVGNAIDAVHAGATVSISTCLSQDQRSAVVKVANPGRQFSPEELKTFFQPGHTTKRQSGHLGLGLSISKRAIEVSGGTLELHSPASGGVEAIVTLPLAR